MTPNGKNKVIAVDLDGTLAKNYEGEFSPEKIGKPVPLMMTRVKKWIKQGHEVRIFTARAQDPNNIKPIQKWLKKHGIPDLLVTNQKTMDIDEIWDDKAVVVGKNNGETYGAPDGKISEDYYSLFRELEKDIINSVAQ